MDISTLLERTAERLVEDESLRSHLDDQQANAVLNRALSWLENQLSQVGPAAEPVLEQHLPHVVKAMRAINTTMDSSQPPALQAALDQWLPLGPPGAPPVEKTAVPQKMSLLRRAARRLQSIWRRSTASGQPRT